MTISWIYAMDLNRLIGDGNKLPWKSKTDMKYFREITTGNVVIMGRKTFESLGCKPLPRRYNIVLTRDKDYKVPDGVIVLNNIEDIKNISHENIFIIGGAELFKSTYHIVDKIYESVIEIESDGDTYMFDWGKNGGEWNLISRKINEDDVSPVVFNIYERS